MIKIDTENEKGAYVELKGTTTEISVEYAAVGRSIFNMIKKDNRIAGMMFMANVMKCFEEFIKEDMEELERGHKSFNDMNIFDLMNLQKRQEDIRRSEFDSDDEFRKWFRGGDDDEEGSED